MLIGVIGDIHGHVFHALAAVATWQRRAGRPFDLVVQAGDFGAYPAPDKFDPAGRAHFEADPANADFIRLLHAEGKRAESLHQLRQELRRPIHFIRGNHEDFAWLDALPVDSATATARADPFDLFHYVPDGTVRQFDGDCCIGFLGGVETDNRRQDAIDPDAYQSLMDLEAGQIDLLVSHDAPYGLSVGYYGQIQGSRMITNLVAHMQPTFYVAGHYGLNGPLALGRTTFLNLNHLIESPRWHPEARGLREGCMAVLDTEAATLSPVMDAWLADFDTPFDFDRWFEAFTAAQNRFEK